MSAMMTANTLDVEKIRRDFPMLAQKMNGRPLVYLDNAATTQKPHGVIDRISEFYRKYYATVHRGVYQISQSATWECDRVREKCRQFLNARRESEIIFVRGATEGINVVAAGYGRKFLKPGDEILLSTIEHHANIVPWQQVSLATGAVLKVIPVNDRGELLMEEYRKLLSDRTRVVAVTHVSNALGTINPVKEIADLAHRSGAVVLIDGAQAVPHLKVDVQDLGADFYVFSGHKIYGPTGVGVLYGRQELLEIMDPYTFGGDMIESVTFEKTTFKKPPAKFEAGTPAIVPIVGLGPAVDYLVSLGFERIQAHEEMLLERATHKLAEIEGVRIIGTARQKAAVVSFVTDFAHPHDMGTILDQEGIAIRTGQHCAQPTMERFKVPATARASFAFYNTAEEVDLLAEAVRKVRMVFL